MSNVGYARIVGFTTDMNISDQKVSFELSIRMNFSLLDHFVAVQCCYNPRDTVRVFFIVTAFRSFIDYDRV